jgi:hypothetical protein
VECRFIFVVEVQWACVLKIKPGEILDGKEFYYLFRDILFILLCIFLYLYFIRDSPIAERIAPFFTNCAFSNVV